MAALLPKFMVIKVTYNGVTNFLYHKKESKQAAGLVSCNGENVFEPLAKIEVEASEIHTMFVHLRFCHTNKYWSRLLPPSESDNWIVATSNQPEEDVTQLSCTLFQPIISSGLLYFAHVQTGKSLQLNPLSTDRGMYLSTAGTGFDFVDWDTLVVMPTNVVFKGDNDKYLKAFMTNDGYPHLQFGSNDGNDQFSPQEVELYPDGHVRIKCTYFGKFWRYNVQKWILANANDSTPIKETLFWPIKIDASTIALKAALNSDQFCKRLWIEQRTADCLSASAPTIDKYARLVVEELILERSIYNVRYRMEDARVYDETPFVAGNGGGDNDSDAESTTSIRIQYEKKNSYSFTSGFSLSTGVTTSIQAGIPLIAEVGFEISVEMTTNLEWASVTEETTTAEATYTTKVPPKSRVSIDFVGTQGKCSVPFSYTRKDKRSTDGQLVTSQHTDGIFNGVNYYRFHFAQPAIEPLVIKGNTP